MYAYSRVRRRPENTKTRDFEFQDQDCKPNLKTKTPELQAYPLMRSFTALAMQNAVTTATNLQPLHRYGNVCHHTLSKYQCLTSATSQNVRIAALTVNAHLTISHNTTNLHKL